MEVQTNNGPRTITITYTQHLMRTIPVAVGIDVPATTLVIAREMPDGGR